MATDDETPGDLTSVGKHHGNQPPTHTGQTVRSPEGPDPQGESAQSSAALFQLLRSADGDRVQLKTYSPRAVVSDPEGEDEELGQYRTVDALREGLENANIEGWTAVFADSETGQTIVEPDVSPDHSWIGNVRYQTVTFFADEDAATTYADKHDSSV